LLHIRGCWLLLEKPSDVWQCPKELDSRRDREPALWTCVYQTRPTSGPVAVGVAAAEGHTSCAELFKAERAFKGECKKVYPQPLKRRPSSQLPTSNEVEIGRRMPEQMAISTRGVAAEAF